MIFGALNHPLGAAYGPVSDCLSISVARDPMESLSDIMEALDAGEMTAWVASDGDNLHSVTVTEILEGGAGKQCFIRHCARAKGGASLQDWLGFLPVIEEYARLNGCAEIRLVGREGWDRVLPGYSKKAVLLSKALEAPAVQIKAEGARYGF